MEKIIYLLILSLFLSSCNFLWYKIEKNVKEDVVLNNNIEETNSWVVEEKNKKINKLEDLWNSSKEIVDSFYSKDTKKQEEIKEWLENPKNERTSEKWDIIEFLDYCETVTKLKTKNSIIRFITKNWDRKDFNKIINNEKFKIFYNENKNIKTSALYSWFKYKDFNYNILYKFIINNDYKKTNIALFSVASILAFLNNNINYKELKANLLADKKNYNYLYIEYLDNYNLWKSCKDFFINKWKYKWSWRISNIQ